MKLSAILLLAILLLGVTPASAFSEPTNPQHPLRLPSNHSVILNARGSLIKVNVNGERANVSEIRNPHSPFEYRRSRVYTKDIYKGKTPINLESEPVIYNVELKKDRYQNYTTIVTVKSRKETRINVTLTPVTVNLSRGLVAYYSFDDVHDNVLPDDSGNGHDGIIHGNPETVEGVVGKAMEFDGIDDWIYVGDSRDLRLSSFTLSFWVRINPDDEKFMNDRVMWIGKGGLGDDCYGDNTNYLVYSKDGYLYAGFESEAHSCYGVDNDEFIKVPLERFRGWVFVTLTYDENSGELNLYLNGSKVDSIKTRNGSELNAQPLTIGMNGLSGFYEDKKFKGVLDEIRIYNRALSEKEIQQLIGMGRTILNDSTWEKVIYWSKTYDSKADDIAKAITVAFNGDIIVAGETNSSGSYDIWVLMLDSEGNIKWQKTYGGSYIDHVNAILPTEDGDIIICGSTRSFGAGGEDVWIFRLDENGNIKWQKTYGGTSDDGAYAAAIAPNGDIIVAGYTWSFGEGSEDFWVFRLDENGSIKWQKTYGGNDWDWATAVAVMSNGDIVVAGNTESFGAGGRDVWVLMLDSEGNIKWQKTYGGNSLDHVESLALTSQGNILIGGISYSFDYGGWILKIDGEGNVLWQKGYKNLIISDIYVESTGNIIVSGDDSYGGIIARIDSNGDVMWKKRYGGKGDSLRSIKLTLDEKIIAGGYTHNFGAQYRDVWVLALPPTGNLGNVSTSNNVETFETSAKVKTTSIEAEVSNAEVHNTWCNPKKVWLPVVRTQKVISVKTVPPALISETFGTPYVTGIADMAVDENDVILVGSMKMQPSDNYDVWVMKVDGTGRIKWLKIYGDYKDEYARAVSVTPTGEIIIAGIHWYSPSDSDIFLMKLTKNGELKWKKYFGYIYNETANDIEVDSKGNIITVGTVTVGGVKRAVILKTNPEGDKIFFYRYGFVDSNNDPEDTEATAVVVLGNDDFIVGGYVYNRDAWINHHNIWIQRFRGDSSTLEEVWEYPYTSGAADPQNIYSLTVDRYGWIYAAGYVYTPSGGHPKGLIHCIDSDTKEVYWRHEYLTDYWTVLTDVKVGKDGNLIVTGYTDKKFGSNGGFNGVVLKIDDIDGDVMGTPYLFGTPHMDKGLTIGITQLGKIVVAGYVNDNKVYALWLSDQNGQIDSDFIKVYTEETSEISFSIARLSNGNVLVAGRTSRIDGSSDSTEYDGYITMLSWNSSWALSWYHLYGDSAFDETIKAITQLPDESIVAVGSSYAWSMNMEMGTIIKLDRNGSVLWIKKIGEWGPNKHVTLRAVVPTDDGGLLAVGATDEAGAGGYDVFAVKLSNDGTIEWQKTYGGSEDDFANAIAQDSHGDFIIVGYTKSFGDLDGDAWVIKIDEAGNIEWQKAYGGSGYDGGYSVAITANSIIIGGATENTEGNNEDAFLLCLNEDGSIRWQKAYGGQGEDIILSLTTLPSGDIVATGWTNSFGNGGYDGWLLVIHDNNGNLKWSKSYGGKLDDALYSVTLSKDGTTIFLVGSSESFSSNGEDSWFISVPLSSQYHCAICRDITVGSNDLDITSGDTSAIVTSPTLNVDTTLCIKTEVTPQVSVQYHDERPLGDINGDLRITATDALLYLRFAVGLDISPYQLNPVADDMTGDGRITATDALKVLRIAVGLDKL